MNEKYLIRLEDEGIALRYNLKTGATMMGGCSRIRQDIECIIEEYFGCEIPLPTFPQKRKVRYNWKMGKRAFDQGYARLKENGLIERVKDHGRIVR